MVTVTEGILRDSHVDDLSTFGLIFARDSVENAANFAGAVEPELVTK